MLKDVSKRLIRCCEELGVPPSTINHLLQGDKEVLLAVRSVIDAGVQMIDELLERGPEQGMEKVEIK